jgi:hypothetical protein
VHRGGALPDETPGLENHQAGNQGCKAAKGYHLDLDMSNIEAWIGKLGSCIRFALSNAAHKKAPRRNCTLYNLGEGVQRPKTCTSQLDNRRYQTSLETCQKYALAPPPSENITLATPNTRVPREQTANCISNTAGPSHEGFSRYRHTNSTSAAKQCSPRNEAKNIPTEDFISEFWGKVVGCVKLC